MALWDVYRIQEGREKITLTSAFPLGQTDKLIIIETPHVPHPKEYADDIKHVAHFATIHMEYDSFSAPVEGQAGKIHGLPCLPMWLNLF